MFTQRSFRILVLLGLLPLGGCSTTGPNILHERGAEVWIMDDAGANAQSLMKGTMPQWIWAGRTHFAWWYQDSGALGTIHVANWDNKKSKSTQQAAITDAKSGRHFDWSVDGQWIVFESYRDGNWEIYKVRRDGTGLTNLTNSPTTDERQPSWSKPAGHRRIAYVVDGAHVWSMNSDGSDKKNHTANYEHLVAADTPRWFEPSHTIVFNGSDSKIGQQVFQVAMGGGLIRIMSGSKGKSRLLGTNGSVLLYVRELSGIQEIFARFDQSDVRKIAVNTSIRVDPDLGPQASVDPVELYVSTKSGNIEAIKWHLLTNNRRVVGVGSNPSK